MPKPMARPGPNLDAGAKEDKTKTSTHTPAALMGTGRVNLPIDATRLGVTRTVPQVVRKGPSAEDPAVTVLPSGKVVVAFAVRQGAREHVGMRRAAAPGLPLKAGRPLTRGDRAWHPRLATGPDGSAWMVWCGRKQAVERGDHRRNVYLARILPAPVSKPILVSPKRSSQKDQRRHCDPDLVIDERGLVHVVWEASQATSPLISRVAYRTVAPNGSKGSIEMVSTGPFDRRPSIALADGRVYVAWDSLIEDRPDDLDPDYDVRLRVRTSSVWEERVEVDAGDRIQAAPALAPAPGGGVLIAYHTSERHGLVKWWALRRYQDGAVTQLATSDPAASLLPQGQQQGAELPAIAVHPESGIVFLATRTSHGAYLHAIDGDGVSPALDLTRRGWGARGVRMDMTFAPDGSLLLVRRARHDVVLERFLVSRSGGPPEFEPVEPSKKSERGEGKPGPVPIRSKISEAFRHASIYFGDVHMHSAVSDGTGPPDEIIARAAARGFQFATLTDHDYVVGARMMLSEQDEIMWLTDRFDIAPDFTTLHAFEWTTLPLPRGSGHRNVYFRGPPPSPLYESKNGYGTARLLHKVLAKESAFTAPHHTGWTGTDWKNADPNVQRHVEIVSVHGAFEDAQHQPLPTRAAKRGMFAADGLRIGKKFGFIGGSDAHGILWHHGVGRRMDPWGHGLTGVVAARNDRTAIWDALYARRTFATSGARMWALTAINGAPQGDEVTVTGKPVVKWEVHGTMPLEQVAVVRDGRVVHEIDVDGDAHEGSFTDEKVQPGAHSYYVRAHQGSGIENTDVVWSSPIFVRVVAK